MRKNIGTATADAVPDNESGATIPKATFGDAIATLRAEFGLTQAQFAHRVYVTRQCVSRWETGETQPGIDMVKLICAEFGTSLERFFDMPPGQYCQCCGMPLSTPELHGTEEDGSPSLDYCAWCYEGGSFCSGDVSMDDFIEATACHTAETLDITLDESVSLMGASLPLLQRWSAGRRAQ